MSMMRHFASEPSFRVAPPPESHLRVRLSKPGREAFESMPTSLLRLRPAFLAALHQIEPKKQRPVIRIVLLLAVFAVIGTLSADPSTRSFLVAEGRQVATRYLGAPPARAVATNTEPVVASPPPTPTLDEVLSSMTPPPAVPAPAPAVSPPIPKVNHLQKRGRHIAVP
jgi:hypothetical protein